MFLECFFHFFGSEFSEYANAVIVNIHYLNSFAVKVSRSVHHDFINKLMYEFRCQLSKLSELHLQIILQTFILNIRIEDIAKEYGISRSMIYVHRQKSINSIVNLMNNYIF